MLQFHQGGPDSPLVTVWDPWLANDFVKKAATALNWDKLLFWSNHGIRHGSAVDAVVDYRIINPKATEAEEDQAIFRRTGHLSFQMRRMYAEDPHKRTARGIHLKLLVNYSVPKQVKDANKAMEALVKNLISQHMMEKGDELGEDEEAELMEDVIALGVPELTKKNAKSRKQTAENKKSKRSKKEEASGAGKKKSASNPKRKKMTSQTRTKTNAKASRTKTTTKNKKQQTAKTAKKANPSSAAKKKK
jgi:hypothetical protein